MLRSLLYRVVAVSIVAASLDAQVVTVGPAGSGAMFHSIQEGIDAAPPGGIVRVAAGPYYGAETLTIDKPLTLLGSGSATTSYWADPEPRFAARLPLLVRRVGAGERVHVAGLTLFSGTNSWHANLAFEVTDCDGPVVLSDVALGMTFFGGTAPATAAARIIDSQSVVLDRCTISVRSSGGRVPSALQVIRSEVHLNDCFLASSEPRLAQPSSGQPSLIVDGSVVRISRSSLRGGDGMQYRFPSPAPPPGTAGGPAIQASNSVVYIRGGQGNQLLGGLGGYGGGVGGAAVRADSASLVSTTVDVVAAAGPPDGQAPVTPTFAGNAAFLALGYPLPTLGVQAAIVAPGGHVVLEFGGESGATCWPLLAFDLSEGFELPRVPGQFLLRGIETLSPVILDSSGQGAVSLTVPAVGALSGISAYAQSLSFAPSGWNTVSAPTAVSVW